MFTILHVVFYGSTLIQAAIAYMNFRLTTMATISLLVLVVPFRDW